MISLAEAQAILARDLSPLPPRRVGLDKAAGEYLAKPVTAALTQPPFAASAMDGYAVRSADLTGNTVALALIGEAAAGHAFAGQVGPGEAVRISTGAVLPDGADQVVIQENTQRLDDQVSTDQPAQPGQHIRRAGQDFRAGQTLLDTGHRLTAEAVSLIAAAGHDRVDVTARPRVGVLASGDELVEPGQTPAPGQIINSITSGLMALIRQWGGDPVYLGIARDDEADIRARLGAAPELDLIVPVGGASVGEHDHMRRIITQGGGDIRFAKIAVRPGKPTWFARRPDGKPPLIGLPGNPVSALVMARLVLHPALQALRGEDAQTALIRAQLGSEMAPNGDRETYVRAVWDRQTGIATALPRQDSAILTTLVTAHALIRRPVGAKAAEAGDEVDILPLD